MSESTRKPIRDLTPVWDQAAAATAGTAPFEAVYPGPSWPVKTPPGAGHARVWKMAVLERRAGGGAEHWGHVFVVVGENAPDVVIRPEGGLPGDKDRPEMEPLPAIPGGLLQVRIRPLTEGTADRLRAFALAFQSRAVALARDQLDPEGAA
jgi:hypothetical protein